MKIFTIRLNIFTFALSVALLRVAYAQSRSGFTSFMGKQPPELVIAKDGWINWNGRLSLEKLRGYVVWLEFSYLNCGGCLRMEPHLVRWDQKYRSRGLVIIEVDNGAIDRRDELQKHVETKKPPYPVLWDKEGKTCAAYGVRRYPTAYLISVNGRVLWEGEPAKFLLEKSKPGEPLVMDMDWLHALEKRIVDALKSVDIKKP